MGHNIDISLPSKISNLPKIKQVSCGLYYSVCVDQRKDLFGLLEEMTRVNLEEEETKKTCNVPQKILDIPPVLFISCGSSHTLIITNDLELWSCGNNNHGNYV